MDHLEIIGRLAWRVAKTMPELPHEYTQRKRQDPRLEALFVVPFHAIQTDGVFERWKGRRKRYLYPGDGWKYWSDQLPADGMGHQPHADRGRPRPSAPGRSGSCRGGRATPG